MRQSITNGKQYRTDPTTTKRWWWSSSTSHDINFFTFFSFYFLSLLFSTIFSLSFFLSLFPLFPCSFHSWNHHEWKITQQGTWHSHQSRKDAPKTQHQYCGMKNRRQKMDRKVGEEKKTEDGKSDKKCFLPFFHSLTPLSSTPLVTEASFGVCENKDKNPFILINILFVPFDLPSSDLPSFKLEHCCSSKMFLLKSLIVSFRKNEKIFPIKFLNSKSWLVEEAVNSTMDVLIVFWYLQIFSPWSWS